MVSGNACAMHQQDGQKGNRRKEKAVEDHVADAHLRQGNFAEEEACTPQCTRTGAGGESQGAMRVRGGHLLHCRIDGPLRLNGVPSWSTPFSCGVTTDYAALHPCAVSISEQVCCRARLRADGAASVPGG